MKNPLTRDALIQIIFAAFSVAFLVLLAFRYPALPDRIPVQFQLGGEVSRWADKRIFAPAIAIVVAAFNGYFLLLRRQKREIALILPIVLVVALVIISVLSIL